MCKWRQNSGSMCKPWGTFYKQGEQRGHGKGLKLEEEEAGSERCFIALSH